MVTAAIDQAFAYGRGEFSASELHDISMIRIAGMNTANQESYVQGGWARNLVWAESGSRHYILRADFQKLGLANTVKLDDRSKALLLLR